jgi:predicted small lipoprotein YifL
LPSVRLGVRWTLAVALVLPLALVACGRKGSLDPPPDSAVPQQVPATPAVPPGASPTNFIDPTTPTGAAQPAPVQTTTPPAQKSFILDPFIR